MGHPAPGLHDAGFPSPARPSPRPPVSCPKPVNIDALPYTAYLLLSELAVGSLLVLLLADARGHVERSYVKYCAAQTAVVALLTLPLARWVASGDVAAGYAVRGSGLDAAWVLFVPFSAAALAYAGLTLAGRRPAALAAGAGGAATGVAGLAWLAFALSPPTWGFPGVFLSVATAALALGGVTLAMVLGHWYLVTPRLPNRPLNELTVVALGALALQGAVLVVNVALPVRETPDVAAVLGSGLAANPALWLRVGVGLIFAATLTWMAHLSSREHAMMSATGLLYIAMGSVMAGEVLARGVLFVTAVPV